MSKKSPNVSLLDKLGGRQLAAGALVGELAGEGVTRDEAVKSLIELQGRRLLAVEEPGPYSSLWSYAASPYSLWFWGAVAAVAVSVGLISVTAGVVLYARYVFGSALVLFLPGYALIEALYPKRELDELTRFALSIGLSLALVPLTGLVLNYTPFGIRLLPVTISIAGLTVAFLCVALYRRHQYYRLAKGVV
ncbi:MAG: DUF1616 domain-containing protein [Nitrososphaerota archaeon]|nr:DUF1616 domain-containing protein [Nitrososphaerota archaeon]